MLLAEPEIQLIMRADRVDERELLTNLNAVSVELRKRADQSTSAGDQAGRDASRYRPGVGIVLLNDKGEVFIGRRSDVKHEAWQMPQGGMDQGESPREAALRELREEIGTDNADVLAESEHWLYYDVPPGLAQHAWQGRWQGQRQKWFVMAFKGSDSDIDVATPDAEFNAWRWVSPLELAALAVSFKRQLYRRVLGEFAEIFRD